MKPRSRISWRNIGLVPWLLFCLASVVAAAHPIRTGQTRALIVSGAIAILAGGQFLLWHHKATRIVSLCLLLLILAAAVAPGRPANPATLQRAYLQSLTRYQGVPYVWGGETSRGIDCSGLVRKGLIDAELRTGMATINPATLRDGVQLWWYDCSARALKDGYRDQTRLVVVTPSINALNPSVLRPGDIAVTSNGVHTLAYLGNKVWIEADPGPADKVIQVSVPSRIYWFNTPVHIMRWRCLEG